MITTIGWGIGILALAVVLLALLLWESMKRGVVAEREAAHEQAEGKAARQKAGGWRDDCEAARRESAALRAQLAELNKKASPRVARFRLDGGMTEEEIRRTLRGTKDSPIVKAIEAHLGASIVRDSDAATGEPRELIVTPERTLAPYTAEMRLHDAGKASALAALLAELQELTAEGDEEERKQTAA